MIHYMFLFIVVFKFQLIVKNNVKAVLDIRFTMWRYEVIKYFQAEEIDLSQVFFWTVNYD